MTSSRIDNLPPLARSVNAQTKPVKGMRACKEVLALELRHHHTGDAIEGPYAALWRVRGKVDVSNAIKVCEDASQGILVGNDRDCEVVTISRAHDAGPDLEVQVFAWPAEWVDYFLALRVASRAGEMAPASEWEDHEAHTREQRDLEARINITPKGETT